MVCFRLGAGLLGLVAGAGLLPPGLIPNKLSAIAGVWCTVTWVAGTSEAWRPLCSRGQPTQCLDVRGARSTGSC